MLLTTGKHIGGIPDFVFMRLDISISIRLVRHVPIRYLQFGLNSSISTVLSQRCGGAGMFFISDAVRTTHLRCLVLSVLVLTVLSKTLCWTCS